MSSTFYFQILRFKPGFYTLKLMPPFRLGYLGLSLGTIRYCLVGILQEVLQPATLKPKHKFERG